LAEDHVTLRETEGGVSWMHRFSTLVTVMAFFLILTGTLVSGASGTPVIVLWSSLLGNAGAGSTPPLKYAHVYQFVAAAVIILTLLLALWLWRSGAHRYIKSLASVTVGVLLALAVAVVVCALALSPGAGSLLYAFGVQIFFSLTVCLALFTRTDWRWDHPKTADLVSPSLRQVLVFMTGALFVLAFLGEGFRLKELGIAPHFVLGVVVILCAVWVLEMALSKFPQLKPFKMSAILLAELVGLQLFLGIVSYSMELEARTASGPHPGVLVMTVTHAAVGALVLATSLFVTFQAFKYLATERSTLPVTQSQGSPGIPRQED